MVTAALVVALYHFKVPEQPVAVSVTELPEQMLAPEAMGGVGLPMETVTVLLAVEIQVVPLEMISHLA